MDVPESRYQQAAHRPKDRVAHDRFRPVVFKAYGSEDEPRCCITGTLLHLGAVHLVLHAIGENNVVHLFGESTCTDGHLMGSRNELAMWHIWNEAFHGGTGRHCSPVVGWTSGKLFTWIIHRVSESWWRTLKWYMRTWLVPSG